MLDGSHVAAGGLLISTTMGANVGPDIFVVGFALNGIAVEGGHEVMLHEAWFG